MTTDIPGHVTDCFDLTRPVTCFWALRCYVPHCLSGRSSLPTTRKHVMPDIAVNKVVDARRWAALSRSFAEQPRWLASVLRLRRMHLAALPCVALGLVACGGSDDRSAAVDGATGATGASVTTERVTSVQRNNTTPTWQRSVGRLRERMGSLQGRRHAPRAIRG
jgi:hypothetical protein